MSRTMSLSSIRDEVLGYRDSAIEVGDIDNVLKKLKSYTRGLKRFLASGATEGLETAQETLDIIKEVEKKLHDAMTDSEGSPDINPSEITYSPENRLGGGAFGDVYKCQCRGKSWAVKIPKKDCILTPENVEEFKAEIHVMKKVYHPNVVLFLGASTNPIMIVTELMTGGDLFKLIHDPKKYAALTLERKLNIAIDVAAGMNWLHGICHIIHRDLKPENILLDAAGTPKIADFGLSDILRSEKQSLHDEGYCKGSPRYMAPEVMMGMELTNSVDVYSFGIILYELMTGKLPFEAHNDRDIFIDAVLSGERPVVVQEDRVPPAVVELMTACWAAKPAARPSFDVICDRLRKTLHMTMIPEEEPRSFWDANFKEETEISFGELCEIAEESFVNIEPLKEIICQEGNKITMAHFSRLYKWFGPWFKFDESRDIIQRIIELTRKDWFHGFISKDTAMCRLNNRSLGTFLIRLSDTNPEYPFTITYIFLKGNQPFLDNKRIKKIGVNPAVYEFGGRRFNSLDEIVSCGAELGLFVVSCPKAVVETSY